MSLENLIVKLATDAQAKEVYYRNAVHWSAAYGTSVEVTLKAYEHMIEKVHSRSGGVEIWVLTPKDDPETKNFYASCITVSRRVLVLESGQSSPSVSYGHSLFTALVPSELRGKGYGTRLMSLMHSTLAPHRYPSPQKDQSIAENPSTVCTLYTEAGDYYTRCRPSEGGSGWSLWKSFITNWSLSSTQLPPVQEASAPVEFLSESDATTTLDLDDSNIPGDLFELQRKDPTKTYFAFVPTSPLNAYLIAFSSLSGGPPNPSWGAKISGGSDFMTWVIFTQPKLQLVITRLRATVDSFPVLIRAALQAAQNSGCESMDVWNLPENLRELARETGGETTERDNIAMLKWYGQHPNSKTDNGDVVWALDERYCS